MNEQLSQGINPLTLSSPGNAYCVPMGARSPSPALRPHHVSNFLFVPQTALLSLYFTIRRLEPIRWMAQWRNEGPRCAGGHNLRGAQNHSSGHIFNGGHKQATLRHCLAYCTLSEEEAQFANLGWL